MEVISRLQKTPVVKGFADRMKGGLESLFDEKERERIYEGNAEKLLIERGRG